MPNTAALPILTITEEPQQLPVKDGATVLNTGNVVIVLSTDQVATPANSINLPPNGAYPIPANSGPLWATVSSGSGQVVVFNGVFNIVSPTVVAEISGPVDVTVTNAALTVNGTVGISGTPNVNITNASIPVSGSVSISGTPSVTISGTPNVNITNATLAITGSVTISGTPNVNITNATVPVSGSVSISGTTNVSITSGSVSISGNPTIQQIIDTVSVASVIDILYTGNNVTLPYSPANKTVSNAYNGARCYIINYTGASPTQIILTYFNTTKGIDYNIVVNVPVLSGYNMPIVSFPIAADVGDVIQFEAAHSAGGTGNFTFVVAGVSDSDVIQTSPGLPITATLVGGLQTVSHTFASATSAVLLAAPPTGMAYRLHRVIVSAAVGFLEGTTSSFIYAIAQNQTNVFPDNCNGQIVTEGITAVSTAALTIYVTYDLISIPTIL